MKRIGKPPLLLIHAARSLSHYRTDLILTLVFYTDAENQETHLNLDDGTIDHRPK